MWSARRAPTTARGVAASDGANQSDLYLASGYATADPLDERPDTPRSARSAAGGGTSVPATGSNARISAGTYGRGDSGHTTSGPLSKNEPSGCPVRTTESRPASRS